MCNCWKSCKNYKGNLTLKNKLIRIKNNKNISNSFIMVTSSILGQLLLVVSLPIISRLYSPHEFGVFTVFNNIAMLLIPIINARYDLLIINAKSKEEASVLSIISFVISLSILVIIFPFLILNIILQGDFLSETILLLLTLFLTSLTNIFTSFLNREKLYRTLAIINFLRIFSMILIQIILGYYKFGEIGLIIGFSFSYILGIGIGYKKFKANYSKVSNLNLLKQSFKENLGQLYYSTPSILINSLSFSVIVFLTELMYSTKEVGMYGMAIRVLGVPLTVISASLSKIFMQEANKKYIEEGTFRSYLIKYSLLLGFLSIIMYLPFYLIDKELISVILGNQWSESIYIIRLLIPLYVIRLIVSTISLSVIVFKKQALELVFQSIFLLMSILTFIGAYLLKMSFTELLITNSITLLISYCLYYLMILKNSKNTQKR